MGGRDQADLALGRHAELVPELDALLAEHPLRERLRAQLMLALYRGDRQSEALDVYREGRRRLVEERGLEPADADNLDAALRWAIRHRDGQLALAPAVALGQCWLLRSRYAYAVERTDEALAAAGGAPELRARALLLQDWLMWPLGRGGDREAIVDEAAALAREAGDAALISRAYRSRAHVVLLTARLEEASALAEQAVARTPRYVGVVVGYSYASASSTLSRDARRAGMTARPDAGQHGDQRERDQRLDRQRERFAATRLEAGSATRASRPRIAQSMPTARWSRQLLDHRGPEWHGQ